MQKIILDTNVVVSSLIQKSYPYLIVEYCIDGNVEICLSDAIFREYVEVLNRPKFSRFFDFSRNAEFFLARLSEMASFYKPKEKISEISDEADNRFLELAVEAKADFIITGNTSDFVIQNYRGTKILTPKEFWEWSV